MKKKLVAVGVLLAGLATPVAHAIEVLRLGPKEKIEAKVRANYRAKNRACASP